MNILFISESPQETNSMKKLYKWEHNIKYMVTGWAGFRGIKEKPKSKLNIDLKTFEPIFEYKDSIFNRRKYKGKDVIKNLIKEGKKVDQIWLATDDDEMGHYIAYMLFDDMPEDIKKKTYRFIIWSYSKKEIEKSIKNLKPGIIHWASEKGKAYRVLDKMVGRWLSPMMWKYGKVRSSGRVQAPAVRAIVEKEKEIKAFVPEKYIQVEAEHKWFNSFAYNKNNKKNPTRFDIKSLDELKKKLENAKEWTIIDIVVEDKKKSNPLPFVMTNAINDIIGKSHLKKRKAVESLLNGMKVAKVGDALTTYPRTDNPVLKEVNEVFKIAKNLYPNLAEKHDYSMSWWKKKNKWKNINENHGWIEPENIGRFPKKVYSENFTEEEKQAYEIIWKRTIATQLKPAKIRRYVVIIDIDGVEFRADFKIIVEKNYLEVYSDINPKDYVDEKFMENILKFKRNETIDIKKILFHKKETKPPKRYTQQTLIAFLKSKGITRPSTESATFDILVDRNYATVEKKAIYATENAFSQNEAMQKTANEFLEYEYTRNIEDQLDEILFEKKEYKEFMSKFFSDMQKVLKRNWFGFTKEGENKFNRDKENKNILPKDKIVWKCPKCGKNLLEVKSWKWTIYKKCEDTKWNPKSKEWVWCWYVDMPKPKYVKIEPKVIWKCPKCGKDEVEITTAKWNIYKKCIDTKWNMKTREWIWCGHFEWIKEPPLVTKMREKAKEESKAKKVKKKTTRKTTRKKKITKKTTRNKKK